MESEIVLDAVALDESARRFVRGLHNLLKKYDPTNAEVEQVAHDLAGCFIAAAFEVKPPEEETMTGYSLSYTHEVMGDEGLKTIHGCIVIPANTQDEAIAIFDSKHRGTMTERYLLNEIKKIEPGDK